jgi:hypothetical protein
MRVKSFPKKLFNNFHISLFKKTGITIILLVLLISYGKAQTTYCDLPFDQTEGDTAFDVSGNDVHGIYAGTAVWEDGYINNSISFYDSLYMNIGDVDELNPGTGEVSWSVWFNTDSLVDGMQTLLNFPGGEGWNGNGYIELGIYYGKLQANVLKSTTSISVTSTNNVTDGQWHHAVLIWDAGSKTVTLYLDGFMIGSDTDVALGLPDAQYNGLKFIAGARHTGTGDVASFYTGKLDEFSLYFEALSEQEILDLYARVLPPADLTTTANTLTSISIGWTDQSGNETGFEIWRTLQEQDNFILIDSASANSTSYQDDDPSLIKGKNYCYKVRAFNNTDSISAFSNEVCGSLEIDPEEVFCSLSFDETEGDTAFDASGYNVHGIHTITNPWIDGYLNNAVSFSNDQYMDIGDVNQLNPDTGKVSWSVWFNSDTLINGMQTLLSFSGGAGWNANGYIQLGIYYGKLQAKVHHDETITVNSANNVTNGQWHHATLIWDGATRTVSLYLNGLHVGTASNSEIPLPDDQYDGVKFAAGARRTGNGGETDFYNGMLDELNIYFKALDQQEILDHYNKVIAPADLTTTANTLTSISIGWTDQSDNETGFEIWRSVQGTDNFVLIDDVSQNTTSYIDSSDVLAKGTNYCYKIRAFNGTDSSSVFSNEACGSLEIDNQAVFCSLPFDETEGDTAFDISGYNVHGVHSGSASWMDGYINNAISFSNEQFMDVGDVNQLNPDSGQVTWSVWFNSTDTTETMRTLLSFSGGAGWNGNGYIQLGIYYGRLQAKYHNDESITVTSANNVNNGQWHHAALIWDGETRSISLYLNGIHIGTESNPELALPDDQYDDVKFAAGARRTGNGGETEFYTGMLDELDIYFRALDYQETLDHYNKLVAPSNVEISGNTLSSISISWTDESDNENGFEIWRLEQGNDNYSIIDDIGQDVTTYVDTDASLAKGTTYCYKIRAYNNTDSSSLFSNKACGSLQIDPNAVFCSLPFDEAKGDTAYDVSGYKVDGIYSGSATWIAGHQNNALSFSNEQFLDIGEVNQLNPDSGQVSWSIWFNSTDTTDQMRTLMSFSGGAGWNGNGYIQLGIYYGKLQALVHNDETINVTSAQDVNDGQWHHAALIWDGETRTVSLYLNGLFLGSDSNPELALPDDQYNGVKFAAGARRTGNGGETEFFTGLLDELDIYFRALDAQEIEALYGKPVAPSNLDVTENTATTISIEWTNNSSLATTFGIERKADSDENFTEIGSVNAGNTSYTDSDNALQLGVNYIYRIKAVGYDSEYNYSNETMGSLLPDPNAPLCHLPFDESAGDTAFDVSKNRNHGIYSGSAVWTDGYNNNAISFDGNNYMDIGGINKLNPDTGVATWTVWFNTGENVEETRTLLSYSGGEGWNGNGFIQLAVLYGKLQAFARKQNETVEVSTEQVVTDGQWHHAVLIWNASEREISLYLNGQHIGTNSNSNLGIPDPQIGSTLFCAGAKHTGGNDKENFYIGMLDELYIYKRRLSNAEIEKMYTKSPVEINNRLIDNTIAIYPNPFNRKINIHLNQFTDEQVAIDIFDLQGKKVINTAVYSIPNDLITLNTPAYLSKGIYILKIRSGNTIQSYKITKF